MPDVPDSGQQQAPSCTVVYDGECAICQAFYGWATEKDSHGGLRFEASQSEALPAVAPAVSAARAKDALAFVRSDGQVVYGARAMFLTIGRLPGAWGLLGRVMSSRALSLLCEPAYRLFARHRHRFAGLVRAWKPGP
jgi:predicted DCC family thiol-disulfide oxidoreductase YuxK